MQRRVVLPNDRLESLAIGEVQKAAPTPARAAKAHALFEFLSTLCYATIVPGQLLAVMHRSLREHADAISAEANESSPHAGG